VGGGQLDHPKCCHHADFSIHSRVSSRTDKNSPVLPDNVNFPKAFSKIKISKHLFIFSDVQFYQQIQKWGFPAWLTIQEILPRKVSTANSF